MRQSVISTSDRSSVAGWEVDEDFGPAGEPGLLAVFAGPLPAGAASAARTGRG